MHRLNLHVPRVFYVNAHSSKELQGEGSVWRQVSKALPRSTPVLHLSEYSVAEHIFQDHARYCSSQDLFQDGQEGAFSQNEVHIDSFILCCWKDLED